MIHFMRGMLAACLCLCGCAVPAAGAQHSVELASSTAVLDEPLRAVVHRRPWNAAQLEYPVSCVHAEVRYGDFVVPAGQLQVSAVPMPEVGYVRVAIFSPLVVSEPLVYLRLTLSCDPQLEQQWTLFSEPGDTAPAPKAAMPERVWKDSVAGMLTTAPTVPAANLAAADPPAARPARLQRTALAPRPAAAPAPQLRLDPADNAALAQAVRTLWQQHSQTHYESLQNELAALRHQNEQLQARMQVLQTQVDQRSAPQASASPTPHWRVSAAWVLRDVLPWLVALVLVASLAWFLHWLGSDRESPWRSDADTARTRLSQALSRSSAAPERRPAAPTPRPAIAPALSTAPAVRSIATVEHTLPDEVQDQADEFILAGHLGAVATLLEAHLRTQAHKSAPLLLSLLDIYQQMGQASDAARVVALLSQFFNLRTAASDQDQDQGLEGHPATLHSITAQWNQPSVREVLKNLLLRPTAIEELSLTAFRDVLALYEMAGLRNTADPAYGLDWE